MIRNLLLSLPLSVVMITGSSNASAPRTASAPPVARASVALPPQASVRGTELLLGQVAELDGDAASLARLRTLSLGYAPAPGYVRTLQRWQIADRVRAAVPDVEVRWSGAEVCRVVPEIERVFGTEVQAAAAQEIEASYASREATIRPSGRCADIDVPRGENPVALRVVPESRELRAGTVSIPVQVIVDGTAYQTVWVPFDVELVELVPVLARDVQRGEILGREHFETRTQRLAAGSAAFLSPERAIGSTVLRDLPAGTRVFEADVKRTLLVKQGDTVELLVKKGAVGARAHATALQNGYLGDRIRVSTSDKTKAVTAVVAGRGHVEIDLRASGATSESLP